MDLDSRDLKILTDAVAAKDAEISILGRQSVDAGNEYFAFAIYTSTPSTGQFELLEVSSYPELGSVDQLQYAAKEAFAAATGINVDVPSLVRWGRETGVKVTLSVSEVDTIRDLDAFILDQT